MLQRISFVSVTATLLTALALVGAVPASATPLVASSANPVDVETPTTANVLASAMVGVPYTASIDLSGEEGTRLAAVEVDGLPPGIDHYGEALTEKLTGIPTVPGEYTVTLTAHWHHVQAPYDAFATEQTFTLQVNEALDITVTGETRVAIGQGVNIFLEPTIEGTHIEMVNALPGGLLWDPHALRIWGNAPITLHDHVANFRLILDSQQVMRSVQLDFTPRENPESGTYHEVIFDGGIKGWDSHRWGGVCPAAYPYLDERFGSSESETGEGFTIVKHGDLIDIVKNGGSHDLEGITRIWKGRHGTVTNWHGGDPRYLRIEMHCTNDRRYADESEYA